MQTQITVRHTDASDYHRRYAQEQLEKLNQVHRRIEHVRVILTEEGIEKKAEMTVMVPGQEFHVAESAQSLEVAVDSCVDRIRRSLLKHKDTVRSKDPSREVWH